MMRWNWLPEFESPPKGWSVKPFTSIATVLAGQSPPSDLYNSRSVGLPFLQGNADFGEVSPKPTVWCSAPSKVAPAGSSLISVRAPVGEINRADQAYGIGRGLAALTATGVDPEFLHHALFRWRKPLQRIGQGTTYDAITAHHFRELLVLVPNDPEEQRAIGRAFADVNTTLDTVRCEVVALERLGLALLQNVVTGRVRVEMDSVK